MADPRNSEISWGEDVFVLLHLPPPPTRGAGGIGAGYYYIRFRGTSKGGCQQDQADGTQAAEALPPSSGGVKPDGRTLTPPSEKNAEGEAQRSRCQQHLVDENRVVNAFPGTGLDAGHDGQRHGQQPERQGEMGDVVGQ